MAVMDYVVPVTKIKQSLTFDIKDLYKSFRSFFKERGYKIEEKEYTESGIGENGQKIHFLWQCKKKMDSYTAMIIEINFISDTVPVVLEEDESKKTVHEGTASVTIGGYISKDIEDDWAMRVKTGFDRFVRELYDKFGKKQKFEEYESKLKKDLEAIVYDIKTYLKMNRFD